jgi:hypothetical protein
MAPGPAPSRPLHLLLLVGVVLGGCTPGEDRPSAAVGLGAGSAVTESAPPFLGQRFHRTLLFLSADEGTPVAALWTFQQEVVPEGIFRTRTGYLSGEEQWEELLRDQRITPHHRFPWRILPGGGIRIQMGAGEEIAEISFDLPTRQVSATRGRLLGDWSPDPDRTLRLFQSTLILPTREVRGYLLDSGWAGDDPDIPAPSDWALLIPQGTNPIVLVQEDSEHAPEGEASTWVAWSPVAGAARVWAPLLDIRWTEVTPVERARRNAPTVAGGLMQTPRCIQFPSLRDPSSRRSFHVDVLGAQGPCSRFGASIWVEGIAPIATSPRGRPRACARLPCITVSPLCMRRDQW